jgi:transcriptional regulator with XRE-family HTH domain
MQTHAERFRYLMQEWSLTQEELGNLCGIKRGTVGTIVNGKTTPDVGALVELKKARPELSWDWLLTGAGEPFTGERRLSSVAHTRAHGEARTKAHPTVEPADKELTSGTQTGPTMFVNEAGTLENHWKLIAEERAARLDDKDQEIARLMQQLEAWQEAFRKPLASAEAATRLTHSASTPIGPRFDSVPANMWVNREEEKLAA